MAEEEGESILMQQIITIVLIALVFITATLFILNNATGDVAKKEILAKQLCVIITGSEKNTRLNITTNFAIEKKEKGILVKKNSLDVGYFYPCEGKILDISKEDENIVINIG